MKELVPVFKWHAQGFQNGHQWQFRRYILDKLAAPLAGNVIDDACGHLAQPRLKRSDRARCECIPDHFPILHMARRIHIDNEVLRHHFGIVTVSGFHWKGAAFR